MNEKKTHPITVLICALGGEGGGVLSEWLVEAALRAGFPVLSSSIPGVAQRTGATTYYVEIFPVPDAELNERRPVFSLYPVPGALDVLVSSELLETVRQIGNGMASAQRTQIITSSARSLTTNERMQLGDGRMSTDALAAAVRRNSREHHLLDMSALTLEAGTVVSAVMFGSIAASGALPFSRDVCEAVIREGGKGVEASLRGFRKAFDIVTSARQWAVFVQEAVVAETAPPSRPEATPSTPSKGLPNDVARLFPKAIHDVLSLGYERMLDYQDRAYAQLYVSRMVRILEAEGVSDPTGARGWSTTREAARYLALWMAFDDIVRVADLKCRTARRERVRQEVKVGEGDLLRVYDHFKPGVPEIVALLPESLAHVLTRWDRRRQLRGREPFALPLKIGTHTVSGFLALRALASMRWLRRRGSRFSQEQVLIGRWLMAIEQGARSDWSLGHEVALCGRLIKGYGSTNERGKENLLHVIDHLARSAVLGSAKARADAIRAARSAALDDEAGTALDKTLTKHGAPARPMRESPIRFFRPAKMQAGIAPAGGPTPR